MKQQLQRYVGHVVRLNQQTFAEVSRRARRRGQMLENCFVVAEVSRQMHKLVCYGASLRILVGAADVVLI